MTHVWVVAEGEHAEGQWPVRAFSNLAGAREWATDNYGVTPQPIGAGTWMARYEGCDEVWIHRMKVMDR